MRQWLCRQRFCNEGTSGNWFRNRLLRQHNGLMIYNKIERVLVITKWIFNYYNTDFSLDITSKVQKVSQKHTFTHNWLPNDTFRRHLYFLAHHHGMERRGLLGYQRQRRIHLCCLQKSIRWRHLTRQEVKLTLDSDVPPKAAFFSFLDAADIASLWRYVIFLFVYSVCILWPDGGAVSYFKS